MTQVSSKSGRSSRAARGENLARGRVVRPVGVPDEQSHLAGIVDQPAHDPLHAFDVHAVDIRCSMPVVVQSDVRHNADADGRPVTSTKPVLPGRGQGEGQIGEHGVPGLKPPVAHRLTGPAVAISDTRPTSSCPVGKGSCRPLPDRSGPHAHQGNLGTEEPAQSSEEEKPIGRIPRSQREGRFENAGTGDDHHFVTTHPPRHPEEIQDPARDP